MLNATKGYEGMPPSPQWGDNDSHGGGAGGSSQRGGSAMFEQLDRREAQQRSKLSRSASQAQRRMFQAQQSALKRYDQANATWERQSMHLSGRLGVNPRKLLMGAEAIDDYRQKVEELELLAAAKASLGGERSWEVGLRGGGIYYVPIGTGGLYMPIQVRPHHLPPLTPLHSPPLLPCPTHPTHSYTLPTPSSSDTPVTFPSFTLSPTPPPLSVLFASLSTLLRPPPIIIHPIHTHTHTHTHTYSPLGRSRALRRATLRASEHGRRTRPHPRSPRRPRRCRFRCSRRAAATSSRCPTPPRPPSSRAGGVTAGSSVSRKAKPTTSRVAGSAPPHHPTRARKAARSRARALRRPASRRSRSSKATRTTHPTAAAAQVSCRMSQVSSSSRVRSGGARPPRHRSRPSCSARRR